MIRGRFGVTRNQDGTLADIWSWPWYWRYFAALVTATACVLFAVSGPMATDSDMAKLVVGGGGLLFALTMAYELGCLVLVAAFFGGVWVVVDTFAPDFVFPLSLKLVLITGVAVWAAFLGNTALNLANTNHQSLARVWQSSQSQDERLDVNVEALYDRIHQLEDRISALEKDQGQFEFL